MLMLSLVVFSIFKWFFYKYLWNVDFLLFLFHKKIVFLENPEFSSNSV